MPVEARTLLKTVIGVGISIFKSSRKDYAGLFQPNMIAAAMVMSGMVRTTSAIADMKTSMSLFVITWISIFLSPAHSLAAPILRSLIDVQNESALTQTEERLYIGK